MLSQEAIDRYNAQRNAPASTSDGKDSGNWLASPTAPFNASAANYGAMPQQMNFPAFMPGQQQAIAQQMAQGYGQPAQSYMDQMNQIYRPVGVTAMSEPLTQTMRAWGLQSTGKPGGVEAMDGGFNPQGYQQWGMGTGSPWLDAMFGLNAGQGVPGQGGTVAPDPTGKKKKNKTPSTVSPYTAPTQTLPPFYNTMDGRDEMLRTGQLGGLF